MGEHNPLDAREYVKVRSELSVENGLLLRGCRIVVPRSMRGEILEKLHHGHQGLIRCTLKKVNLVSHSHK